MGIEVKTTKGNAQTDFFMSSNERAFAIEHLETFYLMRVYHFDETNNASDFFEISGKKIDSLKFTPTQYKVSL